MHELLGTLRNMFSVLALL